MIVTQQNVIMQKNVITSAVNEKLFFGSMSVSIKSTSSILNNFANKFDKCKIIDIRPKTSLS